MRTQIWLFILSTIIAIAGFIYLARSFCWIIDGGVIPTTGGARGAGVAGGEEIIIPLVAAMASILFGQTLWVNSRLRRKLRKKRKKVEQVVPPKSDRAGG